MGQCYLCNQSLNNEKPEHIIPNAIGGKLKSRYVLCSKCNNAYSDIDNKLCLDLKLLTNFICPQRDNNKNTIPSIKTQCRDGEYIRYADGSYRKVVQLHLRMEIQYTLILNILLILKLKNMT